MTLPEPFMAELTHEFRPILTMLLGTFPLPFFYCGLNPFLSCLLSLLEDLLEDLPLSVNPSQMTLSLFFHLVL